MNVAISFIVLSIFYSVFINISSYRKKYVPTIDTKLFYKMITLNLIGLILELLCYYTVSNNLSFLLFKTNIFDSKFLISNSLLLVSK